MNFAGLMVCGWTIAGDVCPGTANHVSPWRLEDRIKAAADAGYTGIGLWHGDLAGLQLDEVAARLAAHRITTVEVEHLANWFASGAPREESDRVRMELFAAAAALGARQLKIVPPFGNAGYATAHLAAEFRTLCQQAAAHNLLVALEMIPFSDIPTLAAATSLVTEAACPNGGLLVDIWHLFRSGGTLADLARTPRGYLVAAELCDADAAPHGGLATDSLHHRKFCGEGALDIAGFIATLDRAGYDGPYSVEILSDEVRQMTLKEAATRSFATTRAAWDSA
jgi:sugar phosphate isomerase/epimerase